MKQGERLLGWLLAGIIPFVLWLIWQFVPTPLSLLAAGGAIGLLCGYLLFEHASVRGHASQRVVTEQLMFAALLLVLFSFIGN